jgi:hypothetical protein
LRKTKKNMSGDCFSIMVILIIHRFDLVLHASLIMIYLYSMFLFLFFIKEIKINKNSGEKMQGIFFSFLGMPDIAYIFA